MWHLLREVVAGTNPNERPDASKDGRFVVYEENDQNGIKQIYFRDTVVGGPPVLVSRDILIVILLIILGEIKIVSVLKLVLMAKS
jgi:hypothetical protein